MVEKLVHEDESIELSGVDDEAYSLSDAEFVDEDDGMLDSL